MEHLVRRFVFLYRKQEVRFYFGGSRYLEGTVIGSKGLYLVTLSHFGDRLYVQYIPFFQLKYFTVQGDEALKNKEDDYVE